VIEGPKKPNAAGKLAPAKKPPAKKAAAKKAPKKKAPSAATKSRPSTPTTDVATQKKADSAVGSRFFKRATDRARRIASDPAKLRDIAEKANRSSALRTGPFTAVVDDFRALVRLVVAYARGYYRQIPLDKLIVVVGGLIYVVSPIDAIPDALPVAGFLDDAALVAWIIKAVREELDAFREWEAGSEPPDDDAPTPIPAR
jgi:uncharacterized membrane protein YkvA (DUF1232 family)